MRCCATAPTSTTPLSPSPPLHCHLLQHEDEGMMAGLMVMES
ncbi:multicopper oxidase domain-containing protein [Streptomyces caniscabiei]